MFEQFDVFSLVLIGVIALMTSTIHGATGVAGGFLLSAAIAPIIGVALVVPTISIALLISHSSRAVLNFKDFNKQAFFAITLTAVPCIILFAMLYGRMSVPMIASILGFVILISMPVRRWAKSHKIKAGKKHLSFIGAIYGSLSGVAIGPGMLLIPFMLGYGLTKEAFVATLAVIALLTNIVRTTVYGASDLLNLDILFLGIMAGVMTIPGNWIGRKILHKMTNNNHTILVDVLSVLGALNFFYLAF